jgi:hypothetical protein
VIKLSYKNHKVGKRVDVFVRNKAWPGISQELWEKMFFSLESVNDVIYDEILSILFEDVVS